MYTAFAFIPAVGRGLEVIVTSQRWCLCRDFPYICKIHGWLPLMQIYCGFTIKPSSRGHARSAHTQTHVRTQERAHKRARTRAYTPTHARTHTHARGQHRNQATTTTKPHKTERDKKALPTDIPFSRTELPSTTFSRPSTDKHRAFSSGPLPFTTRTARLS